MKKATGIIPARYQATRFPGKPLALICGRPMVQWVYERAKKSRFLKDLVVATDSELIFQVAKAFGAEVVMTSTGHLSGTERAAEAAEKKNAPIVVVIQGDEPLIRAEMIDGLVTALQDESVPTASLMKRETDVHLLKDRNVVKVVTDGSGFALYFSRSPLPFDPPDFFFRHIGIYGFQRDVLFRVAGLKPTRLEMIEKLEQLRILENGLKMKLVETPFMTLSVDRPEHIIKVEEIIRDETKD